MTGKAYCANPAVAGEQVYRLQEENQSLKARIRYQERKITEGYFGSSTPSSKKPHKVNATAENQGKKGGAKLGHPGVGRKKVLVEEADDVITLPAPDSCPDCGTLLTGKGLRERAVIDLPASRQAGSPSLLRKLCTVVSASGAPTASVLCKLQFRVSCQNVCTVTVF